MCNDTLAHSMTLLGYYLKFPTLAGPLSSVPIKPFFNGMKWQTYLSVNNDVPMKRFTRETFKKVRTCPILVILCIIFPYSFTEHDKLECFRLFDKKRASKTRGSILTVSYPSRHNSLSLGVIHLSIISPWQ